VRRLQEYEVIKNAAEELDHLPRLERDIMLGNASLPDNMPLRSFASDVDLAELVSALQGVLKRSQAFEHHHIAKESLSTRERMSDILATLSQAQSEFVAFERLFDVKEGRHGVVVTFLAILELLKDTLIECVQADVFSRINIRIKQDNESLITNL